MIELAAVSGLGMLPELKAAPLSATTRGTGEVLAAALDDGCTNLVLCIGGSASTDGGAGMVRALGARLLDSRGSEIGNGGIALTNLHDIDSAALRQRVQGATITVACDVNNPLTGPRGAAAVYGPQKGAGPVDVKRLDSALTRWADVVTRATGDDLRDVTGAGAAGGVGFAAIALLGAELRPGIDVVLALTDFKHQLDGATLVITGEGSLDEQTLYGKAAVGVAAAAREAGVPAIAVCGRNRLTAMQVKAAGLSQVYALTEIEPDRARSMIHAASLLERIGERIALDHLQRDGLGRSNRLDKQGPQTTKGPQ